MSSSSDDSMSSVNKPGGASMVVSSSREGMVYSSPDRMSDDTVNKPGDVMAVSPERSMASPPPPPASDSDKSMASPTTASSDSDKSMASPTAAEESNGAAAEESNGAEADSLLKIKIVLITKKKEEKEEAIQEEEYERVKSVEQLVIQIKRTGSELGGCMPEILQVDGLIALENMELGDINFYVVEDIFSEEMLNLVKSKKPELKGIPIIIFSPSPEKKWQRILWKKEDLIQTQTQLCGITMLYDLLKDAKDLNVNLKSDYRVESSDHSEHSSFNAGDESSDDREYNISAGDDEGSGDHDARDDSYSEEEASAENDDNDD